MKITTLTVNYVDGSEEDLYPPTFEMDSIKVFLDNRCPGWTTAVLVLRRNEGVNTMSPDKRWIVVVMTTYGPYHIICNTSAAAGEVYDFFIRLEGVTIEIVEDNKQ
jgi:hypothetical protein